MCKLIEIMVLIESCRRIHQKCRYYEIEHQMGETLKHAPRVRMVDTCFRQVFVVFIRSNIVVTLKLLYHRSHTCVSELQSLLPWKMKASMHNLNPYKTYLIISTSSVIKTSTGVTQLNLCWRGIHSHQILFVKVYTIVYL